MGFSFQYFSIPQGFELFALSGIRCQADYGIIRQITAGNILYIVLFLRNRTEHISFQYFPNFSASLLNTTVADHISCQSTEFLCYTCCIDFQTKFLIIDVISARIIRQGRCLTYYADSRAGGAEFCIGVHSLHDVFCHLCQLSTKHAVVDIYHAEIIKCTHTDSVITIHCIDCQSKIRKGIFIGTARFSAICLIRHFCHASVSFFIFPQTEPSVFFQLFRKFLIHSVLLLPRLFSDVSFLRGSCR